MARLKWRMGDLHKNWRETKKSAVVLAKEGNDGNSTLAVKRLMNDAFKENLGKDLDNCEKAYAKCKDATKKIVNGKGFTAKDQEALLAAVQKLAPAVDATRATLEAYVQAVEDEKSELAADVYKLLNGELTSMLATIKQHETATKNSEDDNREFRNHLRKQDAAKRGSLFYSVELKRDFGSTWIDYED